MSEVFNTKITLLADAIRNKAGLSIKLSLDDMTTAVNNIVIGPTYPEYPGPYSVDANGILATKGKYCTDDIYVNIPTNTIDLTNLSPENVKYGVYIPAMEGTGTFTADGNAASGDIAKGKVAYVKGERIEGSLEISGGGESIELYRCINTDTGYAYGPYQDVSLSGITAPSDMSGNYICIDPSSKGTNRVFSKGSYKIGYDTVSTAWCIADGDDDPKYMNAIFYAKVEGFSTEEGGIDNPKWWDSDDVATSDRTITHEFNMYEAPYDEEWGDPEGWNFYVRLKAGVAYTIGMNCPEDNEDEGMWYYWYMTLKDSKSNTVAEANWNPVTVSGHDITVVMTYTPTEDGLYTIRAQETDVGLVTAIVCSPAPEISTQPSDDLFEQTNWKVGGGDNPGVEVTSAGVADCVQIYDQIEGTGISENSAWRSRDGNWYIWMYTGSGEYNQYRWELGNELRTIHYHYRSEWIYEISPDQMPHPGLCMWTDRNSSSYGDLPTTRIAALDSVEGSPVLSPISMPGRDKVDYCTWSGEVISQGADGSWNGTGVIKSDMTTSRFVPTPGNIYNASGDLLAEAYKGIKGALYSKGDSSYGMSKDPQAMTELTDIRFAKISSGYRNFMGITEDGTLYGGGNNNYGQLGTGDGNTKKTIVKVNDKKWHKVSCGRNHTMALDTDGYLWGTGHNGYGQLCNNNTTNLSSFTKIGTSKWKDVFCIYDRTFLIDNSGNMWGAGSHSGYGTFGDGDTNYKYTLSKLNDKKWASVWGSNNVTLAIDTDGYMWVVGYNYHGQLGLGDSTTRTTFTKLDNQQWIMAASGVNHTVAINSEGYLYAWGYNGNGQLGLGHNDSKYKPTKVGNNKWLEAHATQYASIAVDRYGKIYWFGDSTTYVVLYGSNKPVLMDHPGSCRSFAMFDNYNLFALIDM